MDKRLEGALQIALSVIIVVVALYFSTEAEALQEYGYLGVFVISAISAATIFFPAPGWATVVAMSTVLDPYLLGLAAGVGSAVGEMTGYMAGDGAGNLIENNVKEFKKYKKLIQRYGFFGIFFFALMPNPFFDIAGIVAGGLKIHPLHFFGASALGRTIRYIVLAYLGAFALEFI